MKKLSCVVSCPLDTYSGYGARSRDFVNALKQAYPEWDIKILSQRWGNTRTSFLEDHQDYELASLIIPTITSKPDVWIQITVPNEFQPVGKFNIGVTAGIETTICDPSWIQGCNRMDLVLTSSNHSVETFKRSVFEIKDNSSNTVAGGLKLEKPIEVLFEGYDTQTYSKLEKNTECEVVNLLDSIKENFCFIVTGHWMQGDFSHDRKNIGYTVKAFLETFKNKNNPPALILKTSGGTSSVLDKTEILKKIQNIKKTVNGVHPNVYLLHGDLTDSEMNELYNHPKVKCMVSLTKGEGFGRPLLEFSAVGKPIIASGWSGHIDFLSKEFVTLVQGTLENVHSSAVVKNMLLKESQWFKPDDAAVAKVLKDVVKHYKEYIVRGKRQGSYVRKNFTFEKMKEVLITLVDKYMPDFPEQVELKLPSLTLPKLKKIQ